MAQLILNQPIWSDSVQPICNEEERLLPEFILKYEIGKLPTIVEKGEYVSEENPRQIDSHGLLETPSLHFRLGPNGETISEII